MEKDIDEERPIFSLVHGRYHSGNCWDYVREELDSRGFESIATTLDIENGEVSLNDHAEVVVKEEQKARSGKIIRAGWSWGANVILRHLEDSSVVQLQFISPSLNNGSILAIPEQKGLPTPPEKRYTVLYDIWKEHESSGVVSEQELANDMAVHLFYWDVDDPVVVKRALSTFRSHPRHDENESILDDYPKEVPKSIFIPHRDFVLHREWLNWQAQALGAERVDLENCGHSPMYSQPKKLASFMIEQAKRVS